MKIQIELSELKQMLTEQKRIVAQILISDTYLYNKESTDSDLKSLPIDKERLLIRALSASFPTEFNTLEKFLSL